MNGNGYENTKFCTRFGSNYNPKFNEAENPEDECCKMNQQCDYNLPFGNYRHGYLNVYPYNMNDCECTKKFKQCLLDLDTDLAKELHRLYFSVMNLKCFTFVPRKICVQYSKWFDSCEDYINYVDLEIHDM